MSQMSDASFDLPIVNECSFSFFFSRLYHCDTEENSCNISDSLSIVHDPRFPCLLKLQLLEVRSLKNFVIFCHVGRVIFFCMFYFGLT